MLSTSNPRTMGAKIETPITSTATDMTTDHMETSPSEQVNCAMVAVHHPPEKAVMVAVMVVVHHPPEKAVMCAQRCTLRPMASASFRDCLMLDA
jgi:hypothetical protein